MMHGAWEAILRTRGRSGAVTWSVFLSVGLLLLGLLLPFKGTHAEGIVTNDKRVALVIGISKYQSAPTLPNPGNDARRMAEALRRLNFQVEESYDPDYRTLQTTLRAFGIRAQDADAALIFYAGHGVQVDHVNYMIPSDAKLEREHDLLYEALPLDLFLDEVSQAKKVGILMLDACRSNPFVDRMAKNASSSRPSTVSKGLARVDSPPNTVVAMATRSGEVAEDGGDNSPFTQAVLANLNIQGLELSLFFRNVRDVVLRATANRQEPYVFSSLGVEPFYFNPKPPNRPPVLTEIPELRVSDVPHPNPLHIPRATDPDDDPLVVRIVSLPTSGDIRIDNKPLAGNDVVSLERFMTATYTPDGHANGPVGTFNFVVDDGRGGTVIGSLPISVISSNHPPVVEADRKLVVHRTTTPLNIAPPTDPDKDPLTITVSALPSRGVVLNGSGVVGTGQKLTMKDLGSLVYAPEPDVEGNVGAVRYQVDDGRGGHTEGRIDIEIEPAQDAQVVAAAAPPPAPPVVTPPPPAVVSPPVVAAATSKPVSAPPPPPAAKPVAEPAPLAAAPVVTAMNVPPAEPADAKPVARAPAASAVPPPPPGPFSEDHAIFKECNECPTMVRLAGGSFAMGKGADDATATPVHSVTIRSFAIAERPVSVLEWNACVADGGCDAVPRMADADGRTSMHDLSWDDSQRYITWLSKKTRHLYRLPTEAEWEFAARGNTTSRYWWGDEVGVGLANCTDCGGTQDRKSPLSVELFKANAFGLRGTLGGVSQWVADCWFPSYQGAPNDGSARDQKGCESRVLRGGSFRNDHSNITVAVRNYYDSSVRYDGNGFRVAIDLVGR